MRIGSKGYVTMADGSSRKAIRLRTNVGSAPYFPPLRNRLNAVWLTQHLLTAQRDLYKGLDSFKPLVESIDQFLSEVDACEGQFLLAAWEKIDALTLEMHIQELVEDLHEVICGPFFDEDNPDVVEYAERAWGGIAKLLPWFQDAVRGAHDSGYPDLWRLDEFRAAVNRQIGTGLHEAPSSKGLTSTQPITYRGEVWVEDDAFTCQVERLIVNGFRASMQLSCSDDGGPHTAEGTFELQGGVWHTRTFSVRYPSDHVDTPARFHVSVLEIARDGESARMKAEWDQAGETYLLDADLEIA